MTRSARGTDSTALTCVMRPFCVTGTRSNDEIIAGRGYRIEDAACAVKLAERVRQVAEAERAAAH